MVEDYLLKRLIGGVRKIVFFLLLSIFMIMNSMLPKIRNHRCLIDASVPYRQLSFTNV